MNKIFQIYSFFTPLLWLYYRIGSTLHIYILENKNKLENNDCILWTCCNCRPCVSLNSYWRYKSKHFTISVLQFVE